MQALLNLLRGNTPSTLQTRIVALFSIVTIVPTLLVAIFSALAFNLGVEAWFNDRVNTAVEESLTVAEAYLNEHKENLRADALAMAGDLNRALESGLPNQADFNRLVSTQAALRVLTEVIVFQRNKIVAQGRLSFAVAFERVPQEFLDRAAQGEVVMLNDDPDKVRALVQLKGLEDGYLLVGRLVDGRVVNHFENAQGAVNQYRKLKRHLSRIQIGYSVAFVLVAILLLAIAIRYGMRFARQLSEPVTTLAAAAERVRAGDFSTRVEANASEEEIASLARAFNRMTEQLEAQRRELIEANRELDERRRFSEGVLAGVSAGVVALDKDRRVTLFNRQASQLLEPVQGQSLASLYGIDAVLAEAEQKPGEMVQATLTVMKGEKQISLHVRVTAERLGETLHGFIVTFDDITPLITAQRSAAWSDVARRVAHEIKNPLTPITLAAERLKRKYLKYIEADEAEAFSKYTDTISKHVGDIGRMVEEFVSFARLPAPVFKREELGAIIKKAIFSEQVAHAQVEYVQNIPAEPFYLQADEQQLGQVLGNIMKNAAEAIDARIGQDKEAGNQPAPARIEVTLKREGDQIMVVLCDNGTGFPPGQIQKMMEPYVSTRGRGSGLGLSIVKKIVEEHKGRILLDNRPEGGACVTLYFSAESDINAT